MNERNATGPVSGPSRRDFLGRAAGLAALTIVPRSVLGGPGEVAPSSRPVLAGVGVGGVGFGQVEACEKAGFQVSVLCDVDDDYAKKAYDRWPRARRYRDFREMLQAEGDRIDAVYIGTPDHTHAVIALPALRRKKHVLCVKPLTRTIWESRVLAEAARKAGVATQMTAAPHSGEAGCRTAELIRAGAIGPVREVHTWSNRPVWPQGLVRPAGSDAVPKSLDWELWIGPAPLRPFKERWPEGDLALQGVREAWYKSVYHPFNFRGWWDFGTGALGDMGCHHFNTIVAALGLGHPLRIQACASKAMPESPPLASVVTYDYPARGDMPPVRLVWYDGGLRPPRPAALGGAAPLPPEGTLYVGDEGMMLDGRIFPEERAEKFAGVPRTLPRRPGTWGEWYEACIGKGEAACAFDRAAPLTEIVLLGNIAIRTGKVLEWDGPGMRFTNLDDANRFLKEPYRSGWSLEA